MLTHLSVHNYALIDQLEINFSSGLTIITGETGAGKSILLGALGLIVGERADTQVLLDKKNKCVIEGRFFIKHYGLKDFFQIQELDYSHETIIRREITPEGKSRAFINDTPVTLSQLKELGKRLIDIHSQHETLALNDTGFQISVVDAYARHQSLLQEYRIDYKTYKALQQNLIAMEEKERQNKKDQDYFQFQFNELEGANLESVSQEAMETELGILTNSEKIRETLSITSTALSGGEGNLLSSLNEIKSHLSGIAKYSPAIEALYIRLSSSSIELKDIAEELGHLEGEIVHSPGRIEVLNETLDQLYRLEQKHQVDSVAELLKIKEEFSNKLLEMTTMDVQLLKLKEELVQLEKKLTSKAVQLSKNRAEALPGIEKQVLRLLSMLGMPNGQLKIQQEKLSALGSDGIDSIQFLFSANKGGVLKQIQKVASGGELSRLMLSLKSIIAELTALPAIIFDEIDTGVSGSIADKVGFIMKQMAASMQVITITHLPQIASQGNEHLYVYKEEKSNKTFTRIKLLGKEDRVIEIAKMLSTEHPTAAAIENAKELLRE